ncbi:MAG: hypothetical protein RIS02_435, partial [Pseudomonadota bacterium]
MAFAKFAVMDLSCLRGLMNRN